MKRVIEIIDSHPASFPQDKICFSSSKVPTPLPLKSQIRGDTKELVLPPTKSSLMDEILTEKQNQITSDNEENNVKDTSYEEEIICNLSKNQKNLIQFTVTFQICVTQSHGSWRSIFHKGGQDLQRTPAMWLHQNCNKLHTRISTNINNNDGFDSAITLALNKWYHVAYVCYGNLLILLIDGEYDTIHRFGGTPIFGNSDFKIGAVFNYVSFHGNLKNFRFYNYALRQKSVNRDRLDLGFDDDESLIECNDIPRNSFGLSQSFHNLFKSGEDADICFLVNNSDGNGNVKIHAHSLILKARSEYFCNMFKSGMKESSDLEIPIDDISEHIFCMVLEYIYCGSLQKNVIQNESDLLSLLTASNRFGLKHMEDLCLRNLKKVINDKNVFDIMQIANDQGADAITKHCMSHILRSLNHFISCDKFWELPKPFLRAILENAQNMRIHLEPKQ